MTAAHEVPAGTGYMTRPPSASALLLGQPRGHSQCRARIPLGTWVEQLRGSPNLSNRDK